MTCYLAVGQIMPALLSFDGKIYRWDNPRCLNVWGVQYYNVILFFGSKQSNYFDKIWKIVFYIFMYTVYIYILIFILILLL